MARSLAVTSLVDALADSLRESVLTELTPGAVVGETTVARKYEVARPTAKAAIERLVQEGLLHRDAHRSARVPVLNAEDVADLYFSRTCIESAVMRRLAATSAAPEAAEQTIRDLCDAAAQGPLPALVEPDIRFHRILVDALGSPRLSRMHAGIMAEMRLCMIQVQANRLLDPKTIAAEHTAILEAITDGDTERASAALIDHLDRACKVLIDYLNAGHKP
jgi:DNA-binding GntR family transcriptional regulator